jgi:NAD(P)H-dependent FMN reductase
MITLVIGTNRPGSNSAKVAAEIEGLYREKSVELTVLDLAKMPPEIFHPTAYSEKPPAFAPFAEGILHATGIVWVTPEYNGGIPGVAKYFIDMLQFPESLVGIPACFVGVSAGMWGALRPIEHLESIFKYRFSLIYPHRVYIPDIRGALDENGKLNDPAIRGRLEKQAAGFIDFVRKNKGS